MKTWGQFNFPPAQPQRHPSFLSEFPLTNQSNFSTRGLTAWTGRRGGMERLCHSLFCLLLTNCELISAHTSGGRW